METCESCRFWKPEPESDDSYEGLCRRYPPRLNLAVLEEEVKAGRETTEVPIWAWTRCQTAADDWCGEYQFRIGFSTSDSLTVGIAVAFHGEEPADN